MVVIKSINFGGFKEKSWKIVGLERIIRTHDWTDTKI